MALNKQARAHTKTHRKPTKKYIQRIYGDRDEKLHGDTIKNAH